MVSVEERMGVIQRMIEVSETILISGHRDPDLDSLGSSVALFMALRERYPEKGVKVAVVSRDDIPSVIDRLIYQPDRWDDVIFLDDRGDDTFSSRNPFDLVIGTDLGNPDRFPDPVKVAAGDCRNLAFLDHHISLEDERRLSLANDPSAPSATSLLSRFFDIFGYDVSPDANTAIFAGLVADTCGFTTGNVTSRTFGFASGVSSSMGESPSRVMNQVLGDKTLDEMEAVARTIINTSHDCHGRFFWYVRPDHDEMAEVMLRTSLPIKTLVRNHGYEVAMSAVRDGDGSYRVSLRSSGGYGVRRIAVMYGGGGHELASGCRVPDDETLGHLMGDVREMLEEHDDD